MKTIISMVFVCYTMLDLDTENHVIEVCPVLPSCAHGYT